MRILTREQEDLAFESQFRGDTLTRTAELLGFNSPMHFYEFRKTHPNFSKALSDARNAGSEMIEDEIRYVADNYDNAHTARVKMEALCRLLGYRDPQKYGTNRIDMTVTNTGDLGAALARMDAQIEGTYRDVTQSALTPAPQKLNDFSYLW